MCTSRGILVYYLMMYFPTSVYMWFTYKKLSKVLLHTWDSVLWCNYMVAICTVEHEFLYSCTVYMIRDSQVIIQKFSDCHFICRLCHVDTIHNPVVARATFTHWKTTGTVMYLLCIYLY